MEYEKKTVRKITERKNENKIQLLFLINNNKLM